MSKKLRPKQHLGGGLIVASAQPPPTPTKSYFRQSPREKSRRCYPNNNATLGTSEKSRCSRRDLG